MQLVLRLLGHRLSGRPNSLSISCSAAQLQSRRLGSSNIPPALTPACLVLAVQVNLLNMWGTGRNGRSWPNYFWDGLKAVCWTGGCCAAALHVALCVPVLCRAQAAQAARAGAAPTAATGRSNSQTLDANIDSQTLPPCAGMVMGRWAQCLNLLLVLYWDIFPFVADSTSGGIHLDEEHRLEVRFRSGSCKRAMCACRR